MRNPNHKSLLFQRKIHVIRDYMHCCFCLAGSCRHVNQKPFKLIFRIQNMQSLLLYIKLVIQKFVKSFFRINFSFYSNLIFLLSIKNRTLNPFDNSQTTSLESIIHNCLYDIPILNPDTAKRLAYLSYVFFYANVGE